MKLFRYLVFAGTSVVAGCVTAPAPVALSSSEVDAICAMARDIEWHPFGTVAWEEDQERIDELAATASDDDFRKLPHRIRCAKTQVALDSGDGIPFDKFWLSPEGTRAAISGGWFGGELLGGGGICYFSWGENGWTREGCIATWAI